MSRPNLAPGALDRLVGELHALHARAGLPSTREIAKGQPFSYTAVHDLFTKTITEAPKLPVLHRVIEVLARLAPRTSPDEISDKFDELWRAAHAAPFGEPADQADGTEPETAARQSDPAGQAFTTELFFLADDAPPLHDVAAELRRIGFMVRDQPHDLDGMWSLMAYSATTWLSEQDRQLLNDIADRCGADFDGTGTYVGPPEMDDGPGKPESRKPVVDGAASDATLFEVGEVLTTRDALNRMHSLGIGRNDLIKRHASGDWGQAKPSTARANNKAIHSGNDQIMSTYGTGDERLMVITEADHQTTTILCPDDL